MRSSILQLWLLSTLAGIASVAIEQVDTERGNPTRRLQTEHLPNAIQIHPKVISGGQPEGDAAFAELRAIGVRTIISVDGAQPDVGRARNHGLRYVHLPHGYNGISPQRVQELAKAVRDLDGPLYIHCHHGQHRSPAAASVACVSAGLMAPEAALGVLTLAGTSPNYRGLYQAAESARPLDSALLDALEVEFRETVELPPLAEAMVALEQTHDNVLTIAAAGWQAPDDHPDLVPVHEALLLREHFTELLRTGDVQNESQAFRHLLREGERAAKELKALLDARRGGDTTIPNDALQNPLNRVTANCKHCHQRFRDVPLGPSRRNATDDR